MINLLTDIIQSLAICVIAVTVILLTTRVRRHDTRLDVQKITKDYQDARQDPQPICGCTHHQCFHDDNGCGQRAVKYDGTMIVACGCKRYTGPEPLPQVIP